jgi:hypothetical protein
VLEAEGWDRVSIDGEAHSKEAYLISMWKFSERSAARLAVGEEPRTPLRLKYSGPDFFILRSRKLKEVGPNVPDPQFPRELNMSLRPHGMNEVGCMAASGEEASILGNCMYSEFRSSVKSTPDE